MLRMISHTSLYLLTRRARALSLAIALSVVLLSLLALPTVIAAPVVATATSRQDTQVLSDFVTRFVRAQTQTTHGDALHIQVEPVRRDLPICNKLHAVMPKTLRARNAIAVRCLAPQTWNLIVQVHLRLPGKHYTATRTISPGETLGQDDVHTQAADLLRLPADAVTDPAHLLGRVATQRIRQGGIIKSGALRDPDSIQRGQRVHTEARGAGFTMRSEGLALQGGAPGSTIQVRTASGTVISAIVINAATVQVPL